MLYFLKKKTKKNICRYHYQNLDMTYSSWDIVQNILKLVTLVHFLPFYPPKNPKNQNFENWKNLLEISSFYTCVPKITIYDIHFLRCNIMGYFLPFYHTHTHLPNDPKNQNFKKINK